MATNDEVVTLVLDQAPSTLTFSNLFVPKAIGKKGKEQGEPKYSGTFEVDPTSPVFKLVKEEALKLAARRWPGRDTNELKFPWAKGSELADKAKRETPPKDREFSRGKAVITARTKHEPTLSYVDGRTLVENLEGERRAAAKSKFYPGVQVLFEVGLKAYEGVGANPDGVNAYLNKVCSLAKGEKIQGLGGGQSSAETFKGYLGTTRDYDPTAGGAADDEQF